MVLPDISGLTLDELSEHSRIVEHELFRRRRLTTIPKEMEEMARDYLRASGVQQGDEWAQPDGAHDAYPDGWTVARGGKAWASLTPGNVWEPGVSGWREVDPVDTSVPAPDWVQPTGAHDIYNKDDVVSHQGQEWVSTVENNAWEPGAYGWTVTPA